MTISRKCKPSKRGSSLCSIFGHLPLTSILFISAPVSCTSEKKFASKIVFFDCACWKSVTFSPLWICWHSLMVAMQTTTAIMNPTVIPTAYRYNIQVQLAFGIFGDRSSVIFMWLNHQQICSWTLSTSDKDLE